MLSLCRIMALLNCWSYFVAALAALFSFICILTTVSSSLTDCYDILVKAGLLDDRKEVTGFIDKVNAARKAIKFLKTGITMLKDKNEDISGRVNKALVSLRSLDTTLQRVRNESESRPQQNPHEVEMLEEIYSDLETALSSIKLKVDDNKKFHLTSTNFPTKLKQWITTTQTKQQLQEVEDKIKEAKQKSVELTSMSTSYTARRVEMLALFNKSGKWPVKNKAISRPSPPQDLSVQKLGNKFKITWSLAAGCRPEYFEVRYDEENCSTITLDGNECSTELGFPEIDPGRIYNVKIRGINEGGSGHWSKSVVVKFTKPVPCQPNPPKMYMAHPWTVVVMVETPKPHCDTESPVTKWNIQYIAGGQKWITIPIDVKPGKNRREFEVVIIYSNSNYSFRVQAINAEGASRFSETASFKAEYKTYYNIVWSGITNVMTKIFH